MGAPRLLGVDGQGRETLTFLDGYVAWQSPTDRVSSAESLADRSRVVETILWWQNRCWRGIDAGAEAGDAAMAGLRASGAVRTVRAAYDWVLAHRAEIEAALRPAITR